MKRKFLEDLGLEKDTIDKILDENSTDIGKAKGSVETLETKISDLEGEIKSRDKQLEEVKKSAGDNEDLKKQIEELQGTNKTTKAEYESKIKQMQVDGAVKDALTKSGAKNITAVKALLKDLDKEIGRAHV